MQDMLFYTSVCSSQSWVFYGWWHYHIAPYYTAVVLSMPENFRIAPAASWDIKAAVQLPHWKPTELEHLTVTVNRSRHVLFAETAKGRLPSITIQQTLMSWFRTAYLRLVYPCSTLLSTLTSLT